MNDSWGNVRHRHNRRKAIEYRTLKTQDVLTVAEGAPQLAGWVGKWIPSTWAGRSCNVKVADRVTFINGEAHVNVEREYPFTGGIMPVKSLLVALPQPMALMIRPTMAIVVYKEKTAW